MRQRETKKLACCRQHALSVRYPVDHSFFPRPLELKRAAAAAAGDLHAEFEVGEELKRESCVELLGKMNRGGRQEGLDSVSPDLE